MDLAIVGSRGLSRRKAEIAHVVFGEIQSKHGRLTRELLVSEAKSPRHPLHGEFTWDNKKAGHERRLQQAGDLIRAVRISYRADPEDEPRVVRAELSVVTDRGREYVSTPKALSNKEHRRQILADALRELDAFRRKYRDLSAAATELAPVFEAIERVKKKVKRAG